METDKALSDNASSSDTRAEHPLLWGVIGFAVIGLFHWWGNTADVGVASTSIFAWMQSRWADYGGTYSHCYLLPFVSAYVVWDRRDLIRYASRSVSLFGLTCVVLGLCLHVAGARCHLPRLSLVSFIFLLWSIPYFLCGWQVARQLIFPCAYLLLMVPLTFLDVITVPMQLLMTSLSTGVLQGLGVGVAANGVEIFLADVSDFRLEVAVGCSGLRSFLALTSLTTAYAFLSRMSLPKKLILCVSAAPIAIIGNMVRIVTVALVAVIGGADAAYWVHEFSGYLVFVVAVLCLVGLSRAMSVNWVERGKGWISSVSHQKSAS